MTGFSEDWLALREQADCNARNADLLLKLQAWRSQHKTLKITDLGTGTGSNLRYLAPRLGQQQIWQLLDDDSTLLAALPRQLAQWADQQAIQIHEQANGALVLEGADFSAKVVRIQKDLAKPLGTDLFHEQHLITASALLDLASREWMDKLVQKLAEANTACSCLFALNVDGRIQWQPPLPFDENVRNLFNQHQKTDKGLGVAAGPDAGAHIAKALKHLGYQVHTGSSDWQLDSNSTQMQKTLAGGFVSAAGELLEHSSKQKTSKHETNKRTSQLLDWQSNRQTLWEAGQSTLMVGHIDVLALPPDDQA